MILQVSGCSSTTWVDSKVVLDTTMVSDSNYVSFLRKYFDWKSMKNRDINCCDFRASEVTTRSDSRIDAEKTSCSWTLNQLKWVILVQGSFIRHQPKLHALLKYASSLIPPKNGYHVMIPTGFLWIPKGSIRFPTKTLDLLNLDAWIHRKNMSQIFPNGDLSW